MKPPGRREEREQESAMICKKPKIDPLRSASKATMQSNTSKEHTGSPAISRGLPLGHILEWSGQRLLANLLEFNFAHSNGI